MIWFKKYLLCVISMMELGYWFKYFLSYLIVLLFKWLVGLFKMSRLVGWIKFLVMVICFFWLFESLLIGFVILLMFSLDNMVFVKVFVFYVLFVFIFVCVVSRCFWCCLFLGFFFSLYSVFLYLCKVFIIVDLLE